LIGFGTWTAFGAGKVMVGLDSSDATFSTVGNTGGSKDAIVVSHTHSATSTDSGHTHAFTASVSSYGPRGGAGSEYWGAQPSGSTTSSSTANVTTTISSTGSSATGANLMPYVVVYMWKRTA
jgi:hypothetical protein